MDIEELNVYQLAMDLAEDIWEIVLGWENFSRYSIGKQWVEAADSIGANISEGFGRYHFKDSKNFLYYSRGSLSETKTWLRKAYNRKLITAEENQDLSQKIRILGIKLNNYINSIGTKSSSKGETDNQLPANTTNHHE
jgi:four helix bundle protein